MTREQYREELNQLVLDHPAEMAWIVQKLGPVPDDTMVDDEMRGKMITALKDVVGGLQNYMT